MPIRTQISLDGRELTVFITGSFDLEAATEFRNAYRMHRACEGFVLDFQETSAITSAGMATSRISIVHANAHVIEALQFAGFERLFEIEKT